MLARVQALASHLSMLDIITSKLGIESGSSILVLRKKFVISFGKIVRLS